MIFLWIIHVIHCSAATSCTAVMSTSLVSSLLLYRHRKVSVNHPHDCLAVIPLGAVTFKICLCSPKRPSVLQEANKQNEFSCLFIRVQQSFYESYPPVSNATRSHLMINKLSCPCAPQGVSVSFLCRDVVWLTEEVLFRNKDVGFGGSMTQIVHYSLSLLSPYIIIAAAPTGLVFSNKMKALCCL